MSGDRIRDRERDESGRYVQRLAPERLLAVLRRADEPMTATELAEEFDVTNRTALNKLDQLHEQNRIERKEVGSRAVVWWVNDVARVTEAVADDPLFDLPTGKSGHADVSERVDEHVAGAFEETPAEESTE